MWKMRLRNNRREEKTELTNIDEEVKKESIAFSALTNLPNKNGGYHSFLFVSVIFVCIVQKFSLILANFT